MNLSTLLVKNLIKLFYILNKTPLGEIEYLSSLYYLLAVQASSFFNSPPFPNTVSQDTMVPYNSLSSTCITYRTPNHAIDPQALAIQPS